MGSTQSANVLHATGPGNPHQNAPHANAVPIAFTHQEEAQLCDLLGRFLNLLHNWGRLRPGCALKVHPVTVT